ncbi:MAG: hypothetical protein CVV37_04505 [Nitrospira bacterium HGW-Nitrospira-1]|nr:MAG: hypothetical protein CVV37_04505 [Nitrospira bacterium HGW-Nitrospira-1]
MGSPLRQVLQGRGDQKGKSFRLKRSISLFFPVSTWLGLLLNFPVTKPGLWFSVSAVTIIITSALHFLAKRREFSIEFLFSLALLYAGFSAAVNFTWLKPAYFPFIIFVSAFYSLKIIIPFSFLIPLLELRTFLVKETFVGEIAFSFFLILTAATSSLIYRRLRNEKQKAVSELEKIKSSAREISPESEMGSLDSNEVISHCFAAMLRTDEEIKELLLTIRQAVLADSANLFVSYDNSYTLRCSTEDNSDIEITGKGMVSASIRDKKPFFSGDLDEKAAEAGYTKNTKISSLIVFPIMDGPVSIGLLTVDSSRYQAFSETDKDTVQMFAKQLVRILERERIYMLIKRDVSVLKILKDGSANLAASLDINVIAQSLCSVAENIAGSQE